MLIGRGIFVGQAADLYPPTVTLTSPVDGAAYIENSLIDYIATASDAQGLVNSVEFFYNTSNSLGISYRDYSTSLLDRLNPLVYYKMGETSGTTIADSSGNGNNGVISGTYTLNQTKLVQNTDDTAIRLASPAQNSDASITGPALGAITFPITLEAWWEPISATTPSSNQTAIVTTHYVENLHIGFTLKALSDGTNYRFEAWMGNGGAVASTNAKAYFTDYDYGVGTKYHIVAVFVDFATVEIYVNGQKISNLTPFGSASSVSTASGVCKVGAFDQNVASNNTIYGYGIYDEVVIYNQQLTQEDILENYYRGRMNYNINEDYDTNILTLTPKAFYKLDEVSGTTMVDSSGNALNGSFVNTPTLNQIGLIKNTSDKSVLFTTANSEYGVATVGTFNSSSAWTLEAWFNPVDLAANRSVIQIKDNTAGNVHTFGIMSITDGSIRLWWYAAGEILTYIVSAASIITAGQSHHLVAKHDGSNNVKLYVNNVLVASGVTTAVHWNSASNFYVAALYNQSDIIDQFQNGYIDGAAIYESELTEEQITTNYLLGVKSRWELLNNSLSIGSYAITAKAIDQNDNPATSSANNITLSASITLETPPSGFVADSADIINFKATTSPLAGTMDKVEFLYDTSNLLNTVYRKYDVSLLDKLNPLVYYKLDETSGTTIIDYSGNGGNGTISGTYTLNQPKIVQNGDGGSILLNSPATGSVALIQGPALGPRTFPLTLECWWSPNDLSGTPITTLPIMSTHFIENDYNGISLYAYYTGNIALLIGGNLGVINSTNYKIHGATSISKAPYEVGKFYHFVAVVESLDTVTLYVNGQHLVADTVIGSLTTAHLDGGNMGVGIFDSSGSSGNTWYGKGYYGHAAIYEAALTQEQVLENFYRGMMDYDLAEDYETNVLSLTPKVYYKLDETSGTSIADSSGNSYNATISGTYTLNEDGIVKNVTNNKNILLNSPAFDSDASVVGPYLGSMTFPITLETWWQPTARSPQLTTFIGTHFVENFISGFNAYYNWGDNTFCGYWGDGTGILSTDTKLWRTTLVAEIGRVYHFVVVFVDANTTRIFINGIERLISAAVGTATTVNTSSGTMTVGKQESGNIYFGKGYYGHAAVYESALTKEQIEINYLLGARDRWTSRNQLPAGTITTEAKSTDTLLSTAIDSNTITVSVADVYKANVTPDLPKAYYRLGEDSGTIAYDSSGNGYHGTYNGDYILNQTDIVVGNTDGAALFNSVGTNGYVKVNKPIIYTALGGTYNGDFTIEAWIQLDSFYMGSGVNVIYREEDFAVLGSLYLGILANTGVPAELGKIRFDVYDGVSLQFIDSNTNLILGTPYHIVLKHIYSSTRREIWINGVLDSWDSFTKDTTVVPNTTLIANVGTETTPLKGKVDEVAVYIG